MNPDAQTAIQLLAPAEVPTVALCLIAALFVASWMKLHRWKPPFVRRWPQAVLFVLRTLVGFMALLGVTAALQRYVTFANTWALWPLLLAGAVAVETVLALYTLERQAVPARTGQLMAGLRVALILLVVLMLCQPVRTFEVSRKVDRHVAVMLDTSASMRLADTGMIPAEKARLAEFIGLANVKRPFHYDEAARVFRQARQDLAAQADGLVALSQIAPDGRQEKLAKRRTATDEALRRLQKTLATQNAALAEPLNSKALKLDDATRAQIADLTGKINTEVLARLEETLKLLNVKLPPPDKKAPADKATAPTLEFDRILDGIRRSFVFLQDCEPRVAALGNSLDALAFDALSADGKKTVDAGVAVKRLDLALSILTQPPKIAVAGQKPGVSLMELLEDSYGVKTYTFASSPAEMAVDKLLKERTAAPADETQEPTSQTTDITAALQKAMTDIPSEQLAGILLFTDGRHNASAPVEPVARRLGQLQIPVCPVFFGAGERPPADAAIIAVDAPDTIYANDRFIANVDLKIDNLAAKNIVVNLLDGTTVVDTKTLTTSVESFRKRIALADKPKNNGFHAYKVVIQPVEGEVSKTNNEYFLPVNVTDDRIKLLIVEGRPRWEFRYLKNLFSSRDSSVKLQYVLLHPDQIADLPPPPAVPASAARPLEDVEATQLPATAAEWLKFDVVILGDVDPTALGRDHLQSLQKFVADRGGTLIVIAGPQYMPHAYANAGFAELLPISFTPGEKPVLVGPEPSFHTALSQEGQEHVIMRLAVNPEENNKIWNELPPVYWRHPIRDTKPGATVLAYAVPNGAPAFLRPLSATEVPGEDVLKSRRQFERENALIVSHNFAHGKVMFMASDHSWRLRYRTGDTYHHKFWGQVLRWATADKIHFGTSLVKVGTDQARYAPDDNVRVRAKMVRPDYSPVTNANATVNILQGDKSILRKHMQFVPDSAGVYAADLGRLPEGQYRIELESDALTEPGGDAKATAPVTAAFGVTRALPAELIELTADRGLLSRLASLTNGVAVEPTQAAAVLDRLGPPSLVQRERRQFDIWNSWPLLLLMIVLAGAEWALRKKVSLP